MMYGHMGGKKAKSPKGYGSKKTSSGRMPKTGGGAMANKMFSTYKHSNTAGKAAPKAGWPVM